MNSKKICFLADSHQLYDDRIYWKEALSLKKMGYDIHYILAGDKDENGVTTEGINFRIIKKDYNINNRVFNYFAKRYLSKGFYNLMYIRAKEVKADVCHIHDLKVNRIGKKLKSLRHHPKVVYDVHEPYPENIIDYKQTSGLSTLIKKVYANHIRRWEHKCAKAYDLIIVTEENVYKRFANFLPAGKVQIIYNYTNLASPDKQIYLRKKEYDAIYTGGITELRGAFKILEAINILKEKKDDVKMLFLGTCFPADLKGKMLNFIKDHHLEENVILHDAVPYNEVAGYYQNSKIGLGIFLPIETHRIILQIKLFEYMNFGLPIIGSNFGHVNKIIKNDHVGIAVNPENPAEIADAMYDFLTDEQLYNTFSKNAMNAVKEKYRWELMEKKLVSLYADLFQEEEINNN